MKKFTIYTVIGCLAFFAAMQTATAGNPDRQGAAGAYELLLNPWARSTGLHGIVSAHIRGVESMRINVAGLGRLNQTEVALSRATYLRGTGIYLNAAGLGQRIGKRGTIGIELMSMDFGDVAVTTNDQPSGTGGTFSPSWFNLGLSYAHLFENGISVGVTARVISESTANASAAGLALDAGVQYVTGPSDNIRLGIALRNVGTSMKFSGEGLSFITESPNGRTEITIDQRAAGFELPSLLHIGGAYDFKINELHRITLVGQFTSNSFSRDQAGGGLEYSFRDMFMVRGAYLKELGATADAVDASVYTGLSAGASLEVPLKKDSKQRFGVDYSYQVTNPWDGTHTIGLRFSL